MIKGTNNGTFGFGQTRALFPPSMNGPFGFNNYPLPVNLDLPAILTGLDPKYNARDINMPSYNESSSRSIMGYSNGKINLGEDGFDFNMKLPSNPINVLSGIKYSDINDSNLVLIPRRS
jgi:hypothetical protein